MKVKFALIYALAGLAFLGVSLWLMLSGGRSARATRAKYRLGGIMLTAWSMLAATSCTGGPPQVTCYEPVEPAQVTCYDVAMPSDMLQINAKDSAERIFKPGDEMSIIIDRPSGDKYILRIHAGDAKSPVFQEISCDVPKEIENEKMEFSRTLGATDYRGKAVVELILVLKAENGQESELLHDSCLITIAG